MFHLGQVDTRPSGYYAVPVDKSTYSLQPMANINRMIEQPTKIIIPNMTPKQQRLITVNGTGELKMPPDLVRLLIVVSSIKPNINDAKASVHKRFEYIYQTLRKHRINESDIFVSKSNHRKENGHYEVVTEISSTIRDFKTYENIYNILTEKLEKTVRIQAPEFFHTPSRIDALKRQTTIQAIRNAKRVGFDLANSVGLALGKPIEISQESFKEFYGNPEANTIISPSDLPRTVNEVINEKTLTLIATVKAVFELKPKKSN